MKLKIRTKRPWIGYPGSTVQQNYAEDVVHGFLLWDLVSRDRFDVKFCELPNPQPFVTIDWQGDVAATVKLARTSHAPGTRFRVHSHDQLSQKDVVELTTGLRNEAQASEVTFKTDRQYNRSVITAGSTSLIKDDLRNPEVILKLLKEHHRDSSVTDLEWENVQELVKRYLSQVDMGDIVRNTKWSLRHLKFDNTFAYGEGNIINFENLNGIIGIFGPNRSGKSSIPGTLMYALFNGTDRGSIKNLHVVNARKPYCYSRAVVRVDATDYVLERQTVKSENRRGDVNASTALNAFRVEENGDLTDLAGEQRNDTEKVIRKLLGSPDDFLLTSLSAQDEIKLFISQGSTKRRQILSRFLDLDVFDKMYDLAKNDVNSTKAVLRNLPDRDWAELETVARRKILDCDELIDRRSTQLVELHERLEDLRRQLAAHNDFTPVTQTQVAGQRDRVAVLNKQVNDVRARVQDGKEKLVVLVDKSEKIEALLKEHNLVDLKRRLDAFRTLESSVIALRHSHDKELAGLKQQERSLKILDDVPCGDSFPTCKYIKDAHLNKDKVEPQRDRVNRALEKLKRADDALVILKQENLSDRVSKIEQLGEMHTRLRVDVSNKHVELVKNDANLEALIANLEPARSKLEELEEALKNEENAEVVSLRTEIDSLQVSIKRLDSEKMTAATERGRVRTVIDKHLEEKDRREAMLLQMKQFELIQHAFSRRGIPSIITTSQLPIINAEIAKILHGIVDYTVEFESDDDDSMEVYINYGDSRRIIELGSGMEKMIASVAIRVALINISSLPKTDMFIIDEGFGALDDASVEACNRLLVALKRYFRTVIVITHVDGVKDAADLVIEVTKNEKDSRVTYA